MPSKDYKSFRDAIALKESSNNYSCVNTLGYVGRYQFGLARLADFGVCVRISGSSGYANAKFTWVPPFSESSFLGTPSLQDAVFDLHVIGTIKEATKICGSRLNATVNGVHLTISGAVACCHLLGNGGLLDFIGGTVETDSYGTSATDYINLFAGYDLSGVTPPSQKLPNYLKPIPAPAPTPPVVPAPVVEAPLPPVPSKPNFWVSLVELLAKIFTKH